ncbi:MAG: 50S ribosomal protein L5 [Candidatus Moanabacter tarae]|uniref:Large ribosomal subunit protein uL5 n=1 Tax=Candidatus Moanibacter tarae TaxID=2200854 RepID=A0A2Z4AP10_9BACT|nr:MAG: 50S ribosomal protein L5 [Candidatus Moanabacter tarae]|tara:strand:+ start:10750 stop:11292 length:543 start_codon:yes stop_codon:yes gene_type:complete
MYIPLLKTHYQEKIVPAMMESQGYSNLHEVPEIEKVVINSGINSRLEKGAVEDTTKEISLLSGQKPVVTNARRSVSNFNIREDQPVGVKVTLRGNNMYEFLSRLLNIALPGIRDFRGISTKLDGHGNYSIGIVDHTIFPEISMDSVKRIVGMDISIVTTAKTDEEGYELLNQFGMPFRTR